MEKQFLDEEKPKQEEEKSENDNNLDDFDEDTVKEILAIRETVNFTIEKISRSTSNMHLLPNKKTNKESVSYYLVYLLLEHPKNSGKKMKIKVQDVLKRRIERSRVKKVIRIYLIGRLLRS